MSDDPRTKKPEDLKSRSRAFLFFFANTAFLVIVSIVWTVAFVFVSQRTSDWTWLARSGSVDGIIGGVLTCRAVLRLSREERIRMRHMNVVEVSSTSELEDQERDSIAVQFGVCLLVVGTLLWAYGDLLPRLLPGA